MTSHSEHHPLFTPRKEVDPHMHYLRVFIRGFVCGALIIGMAWVFMQVAQ